MMSSIFEFKDIEPQLTEEQKIDLKHEIKLAMRNKEKKDGIQAVQFGDFGRKIAILTSGKVLFVPEEDKLGCCPECGKVNQ